VRLTFPLYTGGFLGPFGGAMLIASISNVAEGLNTSLAPVAGAITAYMVPFAALQLVSGTLASRLGPRRIVRAGNLVYGGAALIYVPLFDLDARARFYLAAGFSLLVALLLLPWFPRYAELKA
jgi:ACDE family multidrug resistance protein